METVIAERMPGTKLIQIAQMHPANESVLENIFISVEMGSAYPGLSCVMERVSSRH